MIARLRYRHRNAQLVWRRRSPQRTGVWAWAGVPRDGERRCRLVQEREGERVDGLAPATLLVRRVQDEVSDEAPVDILGVPPPEAVLEVVLRVAADGRGNERAVMGEQLLQIRGLWRGLRRDRVVVDAHARDDGRDALAARLTWDAHVQACQDLARGMEEQVLVRIGAIWRGVHDLLGLL
jgi:hypothetical protein